MASIGFPSLAKRATLSDGTTYGYVYSSAKSSNPTFLLIHGYPATSFDWRHQIRYLSDLGYGVVAVDCLGYGDTDSPIALEAYRQKLISKQITEILDKEGIEKVIGVGHDWGSGVLSHLAVFYPQRFSKLAFLNVGYAAPGEGFDVDAINAATIAGFGYPAFGYWYFFNQPGAGAVIENNLESYFDLLFDPDPTAATRNFCPIGAAKKWLQQGKTGERPSWITEEEKQIWLKSMKGSHEGKLNYYKSLMRGTNEQDTKDITPEQKKLKVPVLYVGGKQEVICLAEPQAQATKAWAENVRDERLDCGHWSMLEKRQEVNELLADFAKA